MATRLERQIGFLLAFAAVVWATWHVASVRELHLAYLRLGPMQLLMAGLLVWLHGKYRGSAHVNRA